MQTIKKPFRLVPLGLVLVFAGCSNPFGLRDYLNGPLAETGVLENTDVSLSSPAFGAQPTAPATIDLTATVTNSPLPITKVVFYAGGHEVGEDTTEPYQLSLPDATGAFYDFSAEAVFEGGLRKSSTVTSITMDGVFAKVNLGGVGAPSILAEPSGFFSDQGALPPGYIVDTGEAYSPRGEHGTFGWNTSKSAKTGRNLNLPDTRYVDYFKFGSGTVTWEMAVPTGDYFVRAHAGRNSWRFRQVHVNLSAEGQQLFNDTTTNAAFYLDQTLHSVSVADGRMTLETGAGNDSTANLYFVEIITDGNDYQPPSAPTGLGVSMLRSHTLQLQWSPSQDNTTVLFYRIYRGGTLVGEAEGTRFFVNGLTPGSTYNFAVRAVDMSGNESAASAALTVTTPSGAYARANSITGTITVDGAANEPEWAAAQSYTIANPITGDWGTTSVPNSDLSGRFRALWDSTNLYLLVEVTDDVVQTTDQDKIEVYLDLNNDRSLGYNTDDLQLGFEYGAATSTNTDLDSDGQTVTFTSGAHFATTLTGSGWILEAALPWGDLDIPGGFSAIGNARIGFEIHLQDDDEGDGRDAKLAWSEELIDGAWTSPQRFSTLVLSP